MGSKWRKAKLALGLNLCVFTPSAMDDDDQETSVPPHTERISDAALLSPSPAMSMPLTPTPSSHGLRLSKSMSRSSKKTCSICLGSMKRGGQAIFTGECSHSFHFHCIASNVKHGNQICPVCRAKWKEVPLQCPNLELPSGKARITPVNWPQNNASMTLIRPPTLRSNPNRSAIPLYQPPEPTLFSDDEALDHHQTELQGRTSSSGTLADDDFQRTIKIETYPEVAAVAKSKSYDNFTILIHLKAPLANSGQTRASLPQVSQMPRAPVDLVTVLDISGSMAGTKLALLKRAMGFVIQNLGPNDRLSVIAFSSTARRLFPLRKMSEEGRQQALHAVNSLVASGGTNIAEGLRKGAKVMEDRREKNSVASIILLSDGQDTYTVSSNSGGSREAPDYKVLLPLSMQGNESAAFKIPVHTFGFGTDHDASSMHSISETSGGTFSFIETESVIQDAFAQCIGGLLSVVVKELQLCIESVHPKLSITSIRAGSYPNRVVDDRHRGFINIGDLYADEERDFLVSLNVPADFSSSETSLMKVRCVYSDTLANEMVTLESQDLKITRPERDGQETISVEVDRQRNRFQAAEAMAGARAAAEQGDLIGAISILGKCRKALAETVSAKSNDKLCVALDAELKEMQERMVSRQVYESSGRAYILSGMSSHSWQRATARGDSTNGSSLVSSYQTPSMTEMLTRSQATLLNSPSAQRLVRPKWSFASQPRPR